MRSILVLFGILLFNLQVLVFSSADPGKNLLKSISSFTAQLEVIEIDTLEQFS